MTPVWRVDGDANTEVLLPPLPRRLQFTVVGGAEVRLALQRTKLILTAVASGGGGQDVPSLAGPLVLRLMLDEKETNAPPRLVSMARPYLLPLCLPLLRLSSFSPRDLDNSFIAPSYP